MNSKTTKLRAARVHVAFVLAFGLLTIIATGCGGGGGGGTGSESGVPLIVAGSVQVPNGQVVMHWLPGIGGRWLNYLMPSANAAVSGISSVPDGTQVELVRIDEAGSVVATLASTTTSGGRYAFDLTPLGLDFSSDLVVRVVGGGGVQLRAFVTQTTVDINPDTEATVSLILDHINTNPGTTLADFMPQELTDVTASVDLLTRLSPITAGIDIGTTVTAIKNAVLADANLTAFITAAAGAGQTTDGPGDIGNFFPLAQGNTWKSQGTISENGGPPVSFLNTTMITGTRLINGVNTTVSNETNPDNSGVATEDYLFKDSRGITNRGNNDTTDLLTPQLVPFQIVKFPLQLNSTFEQVNETGLGSGEDIDGDGINETFDITSQVTVAAFEVVSVPAGSFSNSAKIVADTTITIVLSSDGTRVTSAGTLTQWFAPGIGPVKGISKIDSQFAGQSFSETVTEELTVVDFEGPTIPVVSVAVNVDGSVAINWSPSSDDNGILEYRVRRGIFPIARIVGTSFTDIEVEPGSIADYYVRAVDIVGKLSELVPPQTLTISSGGTAVFDPPILGTLTFTPNTSGAGMGVADVNGDGNRDLVISGGDSLQVDTALGPLTGGISFTASSVFFTAFSNDATLPSFHLTNIIGDNLPELLGAANTLVWDTINGVWNDSTGNNQSPQFTASAYIDLNDDEILDIVSQTSDFSPKLLGFLGIGNGAYESSEMELAGIENFVFGNLGPITATDVNRDGLTDLIVWDEDTIRIIRQTTPGIFSVSSSLLVINHQFFRAALLVSDVTGDGYPEIIFADYALDTINTLRVYVNDGNGGFGSNAIVSGTSDPWNFAAGDINGDGIKDIVVGNRLDNDIDLFISQGDGTFTLLSSIASAGFPFFKLADIDRDGDIDILVAGGVFQSRDVNVYLNQ